MYYNFLKSLGPSYLDLSLDPHFLQCKRLPKPSQHSPETVPHLLSKTTHVLHWRHSNDS